MSTMSEDTVRVHTTAVETWRAMAQEMLDKHGELELHHMAMLHHQMDLLYSCTVEFESTDQMQDAMIGLGMLLGSTPGASSLTLHLDTRITGNDTRPDLVGERALSTMTIEVDRIGDAVLFDRRSTLTHYVVLHGQLHTEELVGVSGNAESWIFDTVEQVAGEVVTGHSDLSEKGELSSYLPMLQTVDFFYRLHGWEFLPTELFELRLVNQMLDEFGPRQFTEARSQHHGMRQMTPRVSVVDNGGIQ